MDDPLLVRGLERLGDLSRDRERLIDRNCALNDPIGQRHTLDEFHYEGCGAAGAFDAVNERDVGVIQRGQRPGFAVETREPIGISRHSFRKYLDRHLPCEVDVGGGVNLAHASGTDRRRDLIGPKAGAWSKRHAGIVWRIAK